MLAQVVGLDGDLADVDRVIRRLREDLEAEEVIVRVRLQRQRLDEGARIEAEARVELRERQAQHAPRERRQALVREEAREGHAVLARAPGLDEARAQDERNPPLHEGDGGGDRLRVELRAVAVNLDDVVGVVVDDGPTQARAQVAAVAEVARVAVDGEAQPAGDVARPVRRAVIHDEDVVDEGRRDLAQRLLEEPLHVVRQDHGDDARPTPRRPDGLRPPRSPFGLFGGLEVGRVDEAHVVKTKTRRGEGPREPRPPERITPMSAIRRGRSRRGHDRLPRAVRARLLHVQVLRVLAVHDLHALD